MKNVLVLISSFLFFINCNSKATNILDTVTYSENSLDPNFYLYNYKCYDEVIVKSFNYTLVWNANDCEETMRSHITSIENISGNILKINIWASNIDEAYILIKLDSPSILYMAYMKEHHYENEKTYKKYPNIILKNNVISLAPLFYKSVKNYRDD